jgi:hypothetical protein
MPRTTTSICFTKKTKEETVGGKEIMQTIKSQKNSRGFNQLKLL